MYMEDIVKILKQEEGFRAHVYKCTAGAYTIGYGRNVDQYRGGMGLSEEEAEHLLRNDIIKTHNEVARTFRFFADLDWQRKGVMIQLAFQLGLPRLQKFKKMLHAIEQHDYNTAADELLDSLFAEQVPARAQRVADQLRNG